MPLGGVKILSNSKHRLIYDILFILIGSHLGSAIQSLPLSLSRPQCALVARDSECLPFMLHYFHRDFLPGSDSHG